MLLEATGWSIEVVPGLIPVVDFFRLLAQKRFCSSTWLFSPDGRVSIYGSGIVSSFGETNHVFTGSGRSLRSFREDGDAFWESAGPVKGAARRLGKKFADPLAQSLQTH